MIDWLSHTMAAEAATIAQPANRWDEIEAQAAAARRAQVRRRARSKRGGGALVAVAVAAAVALVALPGHDQTRRVVVRPAGHPTSVTAPPATAPPAAPPSTVSGYLPLYPFASLADANAWRAANEATGAQPWHLDPSMTALSFVRFLGYSDITAAFGVTTNSTGAHVTVGFRNPNGAPVDSAVVHLRKFGTATDAPWEVVGTDDTASFSVTSPHYGSVVTSPLTVGGAINGVDESIRVEVLQASSRLGTFCCLPAGTAPWQARVTFHGATAQVLIVSASTGGGLVADGQFAVTGVRTRPGSTPGL